MAAEALQEILSSPEAVNKLTQDFEAIGVAVTDIKTSIVGSSDGGLSAGAIAGIAVGAVALVVIAGLGAWYWMRAQKVKVVSTV